MPESDSSETQKTTLKIQIPDCFDKYCPEWDILKRSYVGKLVEMKYCKKKEIEGILDHFNEKQISIKLKEDGGSSLYSINLKYAKKLEIKLKE